VVAGKMVGEKSVKFFTTNLIINNRAFLSKI